MVFLHISNWKIKSCKLQLGRAHSFCFRNEVKYIMYFCQLNCIILTGFVLSKCTANMIRPSKTASIPNGLLCPNPMDFSDGTHLLSSGLHRSSNVLGIYMSGKLENDSNSTCKFKTGHRSFDYYITIKLILQKKIPLVLKAGRRCNQYFEFFPFDVQDEFPTSSFSCTTEDESTSNIPKKNAAFLSADLFPTKKQSIRYLSSSKEMQFIIPDQFETMDPVVVVIFKVESADTPCFFQVQQYYRSEIFGQCNSIIKQKLNLEVCGVYNCMELDDLAQELNKWTVDEELDKTRPLGFFVKGLIIPSLIVLTAFLGYIIWKRRMKRQQRLSFLNESVPRGTQTGESNHRSRRNWNMHSVYDSNNDDDYNVPLYEGEPGKSYPDDPPPPYQDQETTPPLYDDECITNPPTYDEAVLS